MRFLLALAACFLAGSAAEATPVCVVLTPDATAVRGVATCDAANAVSIDTSDSRWALWVAQNAAQNAQQLYQRNYQAQITKGVTLTSTGAPALNAVYACDPATQQQIIAEVTSILLNGTFTDGSAALDWPDAGYALHTFSVAQFKSFATAVASYITTLSPQIVGPPGNQGWPANPAITIP
jgi:acyl-CoA synthetase (AMP-forming)/AMP-acid ligase II